MNNFISSSSFYRQTSMVLSTSFLALSFLAGCSATPVREVASTGTGAEFAAESEDSNPEIKSINVDAATRKQYLRGAQIWKDQVLDPALLAAGPLPTKNAIPVESTVTCEFLPDDHPGGTTPKFHCKVLDVTSSSGDKLEGPKKAKVRFNTVKVYSSTIETRLEQALGLFGDADQPMKSVICNGCSDHPDKQKEMANGSHQFAPAVIEESLAGLEIIETGSHYSHDKGQPSSAWYWKELDEEGAGSAQRKTEADALRLLGVFVKHNDSKALQNKIVCVDKGYKDGPCVHVVAYVHDFGNTLGSDGHSIHPLDLDKWKSEPVWKDKNKCVGSIAMIWANGPGLSNPKISESGRAFLAARLQKLVQNQAALTAIFSAAHIENYDDHGSHHTAQEWAQVFTTRAQEIINHTCPE